MLLTRLSDGHQPYCQSLILRTQTLSTQPETAEARSPNNYSKPQALTATQTKAKQTPKTKPSALTSTLCQLSPESWTPDRQPSP